MTLGSLESQCALPDDLDGIPGGFKCKDNKCINENKGYPNLNGAWDACKMISECTYIMRYTNGTFYLRKSDDDYDTTPGLLYVEFKCPGTIILNYLFSTFLIN